MEMATDVKKIRKIQCFIGMKNDSTFGIKSNDVGLTWEVSMTQFGLMLMLMPCGHSKLLIYALQFFR